MNLFMNRGKIVISGDDAEQKYILRTSKKRFNLLLNFCNKEYLIFRKISYCKKFY